jgi:hypothetical protein
MRLTDDLPVADTLLRWMSERESGTWMELRDAASGLLAISGARTSALILALRMSALGHADLDWRDRTWSVAPPALAISRNLGMCAYLAGWRTKWMVDRFEEVCADRDCFTFDIAQTEAPTAMFVKLRDDGIADHVAGHLGARLVWDPAAQLASLVRLPDIADLEPGAAPIEDDELERFDPSSGQFRSLDRAERDGLYRFPRYGRTEHRLRTEGDWRIVGRAEGLAHVMHGTQVIAWSKASADGRTPRAMTVPPWFTLPAIAERAVVSATGLLPVEAGNVRAYRNVSREVSGMIAGGLGLGLEIVDRPLPLSEGSR